MEERESIFDMTQVQIKSKVKQFIKELEQSYQLYKTKPVKWFVENVIKNKINAPRITILKQASNLVSQLPGVFNQIFASQKNVNQIIFQCQHFVDIAFILCQYMITQRKIRQIQYPSSIRDAINNKLSYFFEKQKKKIPSLLRINYVDSFILFKQVSPSQVYNRISSFQLNQLRQEVMLLFNYLIKPWILNSRPNLYYEDLSQIIYWIIILDDDNSQKQQILLSLARLIQNVFCPKKRSDSAFTYFRLFSKLMDILAINYRLEDPFRTYCLAVLLNQWQRNIFSQEIINWLQQKGTSLRPQQIENIFRNSFQIGSIMFLFNLISLFSKILKDRRQFNILYHLFLSYIKKDFLDIVLPNSTFIEAYFQILELYVIGFINYDRLEGQSELDRLTKNLSVILLNRNFNFRKYYETIIKFYKVYEIRFSYLSSISRKFVSYLQRASNYHPDLATIHEIIQDGIFRDVGFPNDDQFSSFSGFQKLNQKKTNRYRGMMNLGNTCYMNSFIQAIFMTKKFRLTILGIRDQQNLSSSKTLFYALSGIFTELSIKKFGINTEIQPDIFKMQTPEPFRSSWQQHDVAQFGRIFLQCLINEIQDQKTKQRIEKIFSNKIRRSLICYTCSKEREQTENILDFILRLDKHDEKISVSKLLGEYFQGENLDGENLVLCDKCKKKTKALSKSHPIRLAECIIITIGLFQYEDRGKKVKKPFSFEFTLNFHKILPNENTIDQNYQLYAFIVHIGKEIQRGHYICYARNLQQNPTTWYCFDDSYVSQRQIAAVSDFNFGQYESPYLLFYSSVRKQRSLQFNFDKIATQLMNK